ncbi:ribosome-recycling factor, mitochondrial [Tribolium castaneum]|uniref:Ribosome-recycling factor, mitochondrial n=1 Tax=Tribolium castaneum TaxID=7070 RepID=D6WBQ5_TRICA|nr:PREDICTED: ribosome-recycling factor, mitochondrial [Tribolium castaneum]EEZ98734.1 Ribosome-recycling factor, mitochondrial-like Protein [Tribolium castaneum]|eukprot:XP_966879.1 PREDICTED: ribosome-recycling factor, mitochondrial [Tribolium castaneum]
MITLRVLSRHINYVAVNRNCLNVTSCIRQLSGLSVLSQERFGNQHSTAALTFVRKYAKGKDRKKEKGKAKVHVNESQLSEIVNVESLKTQMQKAVDLLKEDYVKHLSVRTTTGSVESIPVELDGKTHSLQELAQIIRKNPKTLVINMSVFPQAIPAALKAIEKSGMNLNPQQDGTTLFIPIPKVTTEHRENLAKSAKTMFIKCRDGIRDVQNKQVKSLKKKDKVSEDMARNSEQQIVAIADAYIAEAEKILESKQKELVGKN